MDLGNSVLSEQGLQTEHAEHEHEGCDFFMGCVLCPNRLLKER